MAPALDPQEEHNDILLSTYLSAAKDEDATRPKDWEGSAGGILTFVCIYRFNNVVAQG